jgi:hypothetical protein
MLWKIALYLAIAWGVICTVITVTAFARLAFDAIRTRLRSGTAADPKLVPVEQSALFTTQPSRHRPE